MFIQSLYKYKYCQSSCEYCSKGKQREMLLFTKATLGLSWRDLARMIGIGYTTLRESQDEKWSMKQNVFDRIVEICPECVSFRDFIVEKREDNWGRMIGGLRTKERKHGFLDPKYEKQSISWKSIGGKIGS